MKKRSRKATWVTTQEIADRSAKSTTAVKEWLLSGKCPFGYGIIDSLGNFLAFVLRKDFEEWCQKNNL